MSRYQAMFVRLAAAREGALGAFAMLGDPDLAQSGAILDAMAASGADMIEVGLPFSDPIADGPVIQAAAARARAAGVRIDRCFDLLADFRARHPALPVGLLTYANLVVAGGCDNFYARAAAAGVDSVLVADVPLLEAAPFADAARAHGIDPVLIAAANTPPERLAGIARLGGGYTYCVARAGVTGADAVVRPDRALIDSLRRLGAPAPVLGFGIARPDHVRAALDAGAAGIICGSALVGLVADGRIDAMRALAAELKQATKRALAA